MRERGRGVPIRTRGQTLWYSVGIYVLCDMEQAYLKKTARPFLSLVLALHLYQHPSSSQREERPRGKKRKQSFWLCYLTGVGVGGGVGGGLRKKRNRLLIFNPWQRQYVISYTYTAH